MGLVALNHVGSSRSGIEPLSPALAGRYVKKSLHGTELCNNKKKKRENQSPRKTGWGLSCPGPRHAPRLLLGALSPSIVLSFSSLNALGLWPLEGLGAVPGQQLGGLAGSGVFAAKLPGKP